MTYHTKRNFSLLTIGQFGSIIGDRISTAVFLSIAAAIVASTQSSYQSIAVIIFQTLPFLLFGYLFGLMADLVKKKKMLIIADVARALVLVALYFYHESLWFLYFCVFLVGTLTAMFNPTKKAIIPFLVKKDKIIFFNKFFAVIEIVAMMIGLAFGTFLLSSIGIGNALLFDASTYIFSMLLLMFLSYHDENEILEKKRRESFWGEVKRHMGELKQGLVYLKGNVNLKSVITNLVFFHFLGIAFFISAAIDFSIRTFDFGKDYLINIGLASPNFLIGSHTTFVFLFVAVGALASPLFKMMFKRVRESVLSVYVFTLAALLAFVFTIMAYVLPLSAFYPIFLFSIIFMGVLIGLQYIRVYYLIQIHTKKEFMGRMVSLNDIIWGLALFVGIVAGAYINELFTYKIGILAGGVVYLMGAISFWFTRGKIDW